MVIKMTVYETLSHNDIDGLINGDVVGLFKTLIDDGDVFSKERTELSSGYYLSHSAEKTISPFVERLIELNGDNSNNRLGLYLRAIFIDKWEKIYKGLVTDYNILDENVDERTIEEDTTHVTNFGKQIELVIDDDITMTYGKSTTDSTNNTQTVAKTKGISEIKAVYKDEHVTVEQEQGVYGFNSSSVAPDSKNESDTHTTANGDANYEKVEYSDGKDVDTSTTKGTVTEINTGTDKHTKSGTTTSTNSGNDDEQYTRTMTDKHNGRNSSGATLISAEVDMRKKYTFFDIVYNDIDSVVALPLYL